MSDENLDFTFDYDLFRQLLEVETRRSILALIAEHPDETFYVFAYNTSPLFGYLGLSANTEEGLTVDAERSLQQNPQWYGGYSLDRVRLELRDGLGNWAYFSFTQNDPQFKILSQMFRTGYDWYIDMLYGEKPLMDEDAAWEIFEDYLHKVSQICIDIFKQLDSEGIFGTGEARNRIRLNFMISDQSDYERLLYAKLLNPPEVCEAYRVELGEDADED